jgi:hypothetical protein
LIGLFAAGLLWVVTLQAFAPFCCGLEKAGIVNYYRCNSGYFLRAKLAERDLRTFLGAYERGISTRTPQPTRTPQAGAPDWPLPDWERVGHIGTHPPGLIAGYALLIRLFEHSPRLTEAVLATQPEIVREFFDVIATYPDNAAGPLLQTDRAVLWAASILTHVLAIVTLVPLYFLLRRTCSPEASWQAVAFWPTVPALAVFLPASDTLLPCFGITFLLFWLKGWDRRSAVLCGLSGIVLWTGLFVSLAVLPSAALAVAMTAWEGWICDRSQRPSAPGTSLLRALVWFGLGISLPTLLLWAWAGIRLPVIWFWNLSNHAEFYRCFSRTYWKWLLVNPTELAVAAGLPLTMLAAAAYYRAGKNWRNKAAGPLWCCALVWGCLWLSGKNSGEVARLWIVLTPWLCWLAAAGMTRRQEESAYGNRWSSAIWWVPLAWQLLLGILLASTVTAFPPP